jgi:hypothetical protein
MAQSINRRQRSHSLSEFCWEIIRVLLVKTCGRDGHRVFGVLIKLLVSYLVEPLQATARVCGILVHHHDSFISIPRAARSCTVFKISIGEIGKH